MSRIRFFKSALRLTNLISIILLMSQDGRAGIMRYVITEVEGEFAIDRGGSVLPGLLGMEILEGDEVSSAGNSMLKIEYFSDGVLLNDLTLAGFPSGSWWGNPFQPLRDRGGYTIRRPVSDVPVLILDLGMFRKSKLIEPQETFIVKTPVAVFGVRGFDGIVSFEPTTQKLDFSVFSGVGHVFGDFGEVAVPENHWISATGGVLDSPAQVGTAPAHLGSLAAPCPEPGAFAVTLAGLIFAGGWRLRKKHPSVRLLREDSQTAV